MKTVTLREVTTDNFREVIQLKLENHEKKYVAPNIYSLAQAYVEKNAFAKAIYADEEVVGFTFYGQFEEDDGTYWVARLMVDTEHRRTGYGERAMLLAVEHMQLLEDCEEIFVSFVQGNKDARALYEKIGFLDTGMVEEEELVYVFRFA